MQLRLDRWQQPAELQTSHLSNVLPFNEQMPTVKGKVWDHTSSSKWHRRVFPLQIVAPSVEESLNLVIQVGLVGRTYTPE